MMAEERAKLLRTWHDHGYENLRTSLPLRMSFMGLELHISEDVFAPPGVEQGDPFHHTVLAEVRPSDRVLDMGTGSGVSGILAAKVASEVDLIIFDPPFRWFKPRDLLEVSTADENYRALTKFMTEAKSQLRPGGRILLTRYRTLPGLGGSASEVTTATSTSEPGANSPSSGKPVVEPMK